MDKLRVLDEKAYKWVEKMPPNTWSRSFLVLTASVTFY